MKLFFLIENNDPHSTGGGYYALFKFAEFLAQLGHEIIIYAVNDLEWVEPMANLQIIYRPRIKHRNRVARLADKLLDKACDTLLLWPALKRCDPDWVLGVLKNSAIKATKLGKQQECRVANFIYETPPWLREVYGEKAYQAGNVGYTRDLWLQTKRAYQDSDILLPNSILAGEYCLSWVQEDNKSADVAMGLPIYPGVDSQQMAYEGKRWDWSGINVLFVGRLVPEKNIQLLIQASDKFPTAVTVHIVGGGPLEEELKDQTKGNPNIRIHGFVDDDTLWQFYRSCDLVVCPSKFEGFGMPPMQALYFEKPCVASDLAIFRSIFENHLEYFSCDDANDLARSVTKVLSNYEMYSSKAKTGRSFVLEHFSWETSAKRIETSLQDMP